MSSPAESPTPQMGKLRCTLAVILSLDPSSDIVIQLDYVILANSEEVFTTFAEACARAGAAKCLPIGLIQGNATGPDLRLLFTSIINASL